MIKENIDVGMMTTFKISCLARYFAAPANLSELLETIKWADQLGLKRELLGGGANTLFATQQYDGIVISTSELKKVKLISNNVVEAEAGIDIETLGNFLIDHKLSGMEFAGGLPGSLGGALCMNARAYGNEFSELVLNITYLDGEQKVKTRDVTLLNYAYKQSLFLERPELIIISSQMKFRNKQKEEILSEWEKNKFDRINKDQFAYPSAGCVFKNCYNVGVPTGKIIDELGFKGKTVGGAKVFEKHANFIVNIGQATADDVLTLIELIEKDVWAKKQIHLEREVRVVR